MKIPVDKQLKLKNKVSLFTGLIMTLICISSTIIVLSGNGVEKDIQ